MRLFLVVLAGAVAQACDFPAVEAQARAANQAIGSGRLAEARTSLRAVIDGARECSQSPSTLAIRAMVQLASVERLSGHLKEGLALAVQAVSLAEQEPAANATLLADTLETLAQLQAAAGKYYDAEPVIQRAIEIWQREGGNHRIELASCINTLAVLYLGLADPDGARRQLRRALDYGRDSGADLVVASSLHNLATAAWQEGQSEESLRYLDEAFGMAERTLGANHPYLAGLFESYSRVLSSLRRKAEARQYRDRARSLMALSAR